MAEPIRLDLDVLLPNSVDACDACTMRLTDELSAAAGVDKIHLVPAEGRAAQVCIHYEPTHVDLPRIRRIAERAGARITGRYGHALWETDDLGHQRRARTVATRVRRLPGVVEAEADAGGPIRIEFDRQITDEDSIRAHLNRLGVSIREAGPQSAEARPSDHEPHDAEHGAAHDHETSEPHDHEHGGVFGRATELVFSILAGVATLVGWLLDRWDVDLARWLLIAPFVVAYLFGGWFTVREAIGALRARRLEIDSLMLVAAAGAAVLGEWFEGALLLFLFSLGHALEGYAMGRAKRAIEALAELAPRTALRLLPGGQEEEVAVEELALGDRLLIKPNSRVPADGFVVDGTSAVNQAPITGESIPVDKKPVADPEASLRETASIDDASKVFAGTINGPSSLEVVVTRPAADSTLARVVKMVREAQTQRSPTQRFTDRFERIFVPSVLALATLCMFAWVVLDEPFSASFYRAMAVLVAASPCALAIATPSAVLSGVARAARGGVLIKGGSHLETLGAANVIAFDKTGTLTKGEPRLTSVVEAPGVDHGILARLTVAVERESDHPLATAIVDGLREDLGGSVAEASSVESITGYGVKAQVEGQEVWIGKRGLFEERLDRRLPDEVASAEQRLADAGETTVVVATREEFLGVLGLLDTPRESAKDTLQRLKRLGVRRTIMLTGDHQRAGDAVASLVGIDEARGGLLPEQKVEAIRELGSGDSVVAMVGDGVNDAPAMAQADVGIAMGASGSDVALETADVALMADNLATLPFAVGLSRASRRIIRQNLWASLGMVAFLIPATLFGFAGIGLAVVLHEGSTLIVVANALRLLAYRSAT
ncbi:MAG: heavy metal translocating P-type ATPase [Acidobacteria bacterium]|nr:MAG: heavy metal translocating P-type ATPase [Acidobacteriota bacterium]REK04476.1 MAG: heavy metal translocating P-type ATPase [Acidobacteriota bacterium]